tara:strand:+ start:68 stop:1036 length:969 start_codon:yes stop_codon:yes gene_type:complete
MFPIYMLYLFLYGTDSLTYFIRFEGYAHLDFKPGQVFMNKMIIFFDFLELNFYNINYIFSLFSLLSFLLYLKIIENFKIKNTYNFYIIFSFLCLPSIHFWHMGFSKDTLTFFGISLIIYEMLKSKPNLILILFSIILLYLVRPHMGLITFIPLAAYYFINTKNKFIKILVVFLFLILVPLLMKSIFDFRGFDSLIRFLNMYKDVYVDNEATALYSDTNLIVKILSYVFLPNILFLKDTSLFYLYIAFENTFLILLFFYVINFNFFKIKNLEKNIFLLLFSLISLFIFSYITSNIGIASRQKWIFLPALFILFSRLKYSLNQK